MSSATEEGKCKVVEVVLKRKSLNDTSSLGVIERVLATIGTGENINLDDLKWHRSCYSKFTHIGMLNMLEKKQEGIKTVHEASTSNTVAHKASTRSRHGHNIKWEICMFCQTSEGKNLRNVMTMTMSDKMLSMAEQDVVMRVRLANVCDLVAAEGKYHVQCWVKFQRTISTSNLKTVDPRNSDQSLDRLRSAILTGFILGPRASRLTLRCRRPWRKPKPELQKSCSLPEVNVIKC